LISPHAAAIARCKILAEDNNVTAEDSGATIPEISLEEEELSLACKTIAGALLVFAGVIVVFVPIDLRFGSIFWLVWITVQSLVAFGFLGYALWLDRDAASHIGTVHAPPRQGVSPSSGH
jgi:hypothetical protein